MEKGNGLNLAERLPVLLFLIALAVTTVVHIQNASAAYTYRHGFISATLATSARTFAKEGILPLRGVPVVNNPQLGPRDGYLHWPPLAPALLSLWFRLFGVSEAAGHLWMLAIQIVTVFLIFAIARDWLGVAGGALAGFFWLTMPVIVHYAHILLYPGLAILFMLASVLAYSRSRPFLAAASAFLGMCSSWEAVLLAPALWIAALAGGHPSGRRTALLCTIAITLGLLFVIGGYALHDPVVFADAMNTARYRMGLSQSYSQRLGGCSVERYINSGESLALILRNFWLMLGFFGAGGVIALALARPAGSATILYGLGLPWVAWCVLMRNHTAGHDIQMILGAPVAAIALAWIALGTLKRGINSPQHWLAVSLLVMAIVIQPWILGTDQSPEKPAQMMGFSSAIRVGVGPDSVVLSPLISAIPVYYSERHIVRCISDEHVMIEVLASVQNEFPEAPVYWVTPLESAPWAAIKRVH
jgi:hypothetical protein